VTRQRDIFRTSEGDAWFRRNREVLASRDWSRDPLCRKVAELVEPGRSCRLLEIGCGDGSRLRYLAERLGCQVSGVDPSEEAVSRALSAGIDARVATAERLPYPDAAFDLVLFGFCLYLCDDGDLFDIAREADRMLGRKGWLLLLDFESAAPTYRPYHHHAGVRTRKMDYKKMFLWHPAYTLASHMKCHHETYTWTDDPDQWISLACLRKSLEP
jgi:ubiquinone/menaquinone biosynthesis C-methylase UbiE